MDGFSDIESSNSDVGAEVNEVETSDTDFGDGDGVNDFDDTYESMNNGDEIFEYSQETSGEQESIGDNVEQNPSDMTTDENVDDALSDFEDEYETDKVDIETVTVESDSQNEETSASSIDDSNDENNDGTDLNNDMERELTEKNEVFENVSYSQGQNDLGALGTCGPTSIANSLNRVTESTEYTENEVLHNAMDNNLCYKSDNPYSCGGTTTRDVVNIIDNVRNPDDNIHTEVYEYDKALSVEDLANRLDDYGTVAMVGVDSATLWDQRGDVACSGLFQNTDSPSDHWITVDSPIRDEAGNLTGFNVIDSGGGVSEVSREKFEAMYKGDEGHTVSDPTVIIISNNGESDNIYSSTEGVEKASNYKGNAEVPDGNDSLERIVNLRNTERTSLGIELSPKQKEVNQFFRGDQFNNESSFESTLDELNKKNLINANSSMTCELNDNLVGTYQDNKKYILSVSPEKQYELYKLRSNVSDVTEDTVMQKVISPYQFSEYTKENSPRTDVSGCASKASDVAPYSNNIEQAYETLRLDYNGTMFKEPAENNGDMYVMRFTSDYCPSNSEYPKMDGSELWNKPPCTGTGFTGSSKHLVPEYTYGSGQAISDGAIYRVDAKGNETMVAFWNHGHFEKVK